MEDPRVEEVYSRVKKVISEVLKIAESKISPESNYLTDFGADSLDRVTLVMELEDEFDQDIPDGDAQGLTTVGATVEYILSHIPAEQFMAGDPIA
ncbi:MAG: acyl carrier protein [Firmicutes bacterium]|nr:acyl carrier protein [Bacillota bacterium]